MKNLYVLFIAVMALALLQGGCGGGGGKAGGTTGGGATGRLLVLADFADATRTVPGYADALRVTVTQPAGVALPGTFPNPFLLTRTGTLRLLDNLEPSAQPYVLDMEALTDGTVVGTVQRSIVISAGEVREVDVSANLQSTAFSITVQGVLSMIVGNSAQLTAFAKDGQGATLFSGAGFHWTSTNPSVLSVDQGSGLATAITSGEATVAAALIGTGLSSKAHIRVDPFVPGTKIVFYSDRDGNYEIYVMDSDGSGQTRLTNNPVADGDPTLSPDESRIAFVRRRALHTPYEIWIMNVDGTGATRLDSGSSSNTSPSFNPDGSKIVFAGFSQGVSEIYVMNADGSAVTQLTNNSIRNSMPVFSPDGSKIVYQSNNSIGRDTNEIFIMNADGSGQTRLTFNDVLDEAPRFSRDGTKITFNSDRRGFTMYVMNLDGSGQTKLTANNIGVFPSFSPDGSQIAFMSWRDLNWEILIMNADGTGETRLTDNASFDAVPSFRSGK